MVGSNVSLLWANKRSQGFKKIGANKEIERKKRSHYHCFKSNSYISVAASKDANVSKSWRRKRDERKNEK